MTQRTPERVGAAEESLSSKLKNEASLHAYNLSGPPSAFVEPQTLFFDMSDELWDAKRCAEFLGYSYDHFRKVIRHQPGVPQALDRPGYPRWIAEDWREWARNLRKDYAKAA